MIRGLHFFLISNNEEKEIVGLRLLTKATTGELWELSILSKVISFLEFTSTSSENDTSAAKKMWRKQTQTKSETFLLYIVKLIW